MNNNNNTFAIHDPRSAFQLYFYKVDSPLGVLTLVGSDHGLRGLYLENQKYAPCISPDWKQDDGRLAEASAELQDYFRGTRVEFSVPLDFKGTVFQKTVWASLLEIPYGETISYSELAARIGNVRAVRAVSSAVGRNPISIIVPCHRVIGSNGALTGYAGGLIRKRFLLELEAKVAREFPQIFAKASLRCAP